MQFWRCDLFYFGRRFEFAYLRGKLLEKMSLSLSHTLCVFFLLVVEKMSHLKIIQPVRSVCYLLFVDALVVSLNCQKAYFVGLARTSPWGSLRSQLQSLAAISQKSSTSLSAERDTYTQWERLPKRKKTAPRCITAQFSTIFRWTTMNDSPKTTSWHTSCGRYDTYPHGNAVHFSSIDDVYSKNTDGL